MQPGDVMSRWVESGHLVQAEVIYMLLHASQLDSNWEVLVLLSGHPSVRSGERRTFSSYWIGMSDRLSP